MALLHCHGDSDCNKTRITGNFHLDGVWLPWLQYMASSVTKGQAN